MVMIVLEWSEFIILSYILCSDRIYHFREMSHSVYLIQWSHFLLVVEGEIHTICLASNLPNNS